MDHVFRAILRVTVTVVLAAGLVLLMTPAAAHAQPQTSRETATLPQSPPRPTPALGDVEIEPFDAPGNAVVQDHQGFMWFAGWDGLYRYDGYDFTHYQHDAQDSTTLSVDRLESLHVDRGGTLWVGTFGGGLNRYNDETDTFTRFMHHPDDPTSLSQDSITVILEDSRGTLWVGTHRGLNRFDPDTGTFTHYRHDPTDPTSLSNDQVRALYEDRQGTLWVGTGSPTLTETPAGEGGLNRFEAVTGTFTRFMHDPADPTSLIDNKVMSL
ncbi:MAG: SMP-30/gluconolactonase/LRE family protein, partial [Bacteroidetes bacterium]|nr:SMP-30/gluconolactonase/LRE family protein [Bacteroidota bacterium]